jgi:hypothetical protein
LGHEIIVEIQKLTLFWSGGMEHLYEKIVPLEAESLLHCNKEGGEVAL